MSYEAAHGVGKRFRDAQLKNLDPEYFGDVLTYARNYQKYLAKGEGLLLAGPPGIGKTYAIVALLRYIKLKAGSAFDYFIVTAPRFIDTYAVRPGDVESDTFRGKPLTQTYETVMGMLLNDLGKEERSKEWQEEAAVYKLGRLLRTRHEEQRPIFITTNFSVTRQASRNSMTFQGAYGSSIWSLIQEMTCARLEITAPDRRAEKARQDRLGLE